MPGRRAMKYRKKTVVSARVSSRWLAALDTKEATPPALAHEWADQGDVGLFVHSGTRGPQEPAQAPTVPEGCDDWRDAAGWQVNLLAILSAFIAGIATGKLF
jgi:hypothetical protein